MKSALQGVRVADFGHVLAGPFTSMMLGALGAEVIKIETRKRIDEQRVQHGAGVSNDYESSSNFLEVNFNKLSVSINLATDEGKVLAKRLVAVSDVVVENMRPGVMDKLGLGYADLSKVRPDVIMLSLSGFGQTGPYRRYAAYNPVFTSFGGLSHLTGYADEAPGTMTSSGGDGRAGTAGVFAVLMALNLRQRTGQGQHIDMASCEVINSMIGDQMMDYAMNGRSPMRSGNHDAVAAPHNAYRCKGDDEWISIAVTTDDEWRRLCAALGDPEWARVPDFATFLARQQNQDRLDQLITAWTSRLDYYEAMEKLQAHGVPAMPSFKAEHLFSDPHLMARGAIAEIEHLVLGRRQAITPPWRMTETPARIARTAPLLGEHNSYVLCDLLGLPEAEVARLAEAQVVY